MDFWDILENRNSINSCRELLEEYFENVRKRKSPISDSHTYIRAIKMLKEFVEFSYGDVRSFLQLPIAEIDELHISNKIKTTAEKKLSIVPLRVDIPKPCCDEVSKYLLPWDKLENYALQESALNKLFFKTYPNNNDIDDILIKVSALNDFYSTNIYSPFQVAKHILNLHIDDRLKEGDVTLVNDIAKVSMTNGNVINFYSFATKYCSHHQPLDFPIYDSFVDQLLRYSRNRDGFSNFGSSDLKS